MRVLFVEDDDNKRNSVIAYLSSVFKDDISISIGMSIASGVQLAIDEKFDVIISNPPYIPPQEKPHLQIEVRDYEPYEALFTKDEKGLEFYQKISQNACEYLNNGGYLMFELGQGQACEVKKIMDQNGYTNITVLDDVSGIKRVISGVLIKNI